MIRDQLLLYATIGICLFIIFIYIQGVILKYFIREAIKEAFKEMNLDKKE